MKCVSVCIPHAKNICGTEYTVEALMTEIEKDSIFYGASGGGVTVGGGDPLMQAGFVSEFLKTCKNEYGFNTAIETSAFAVWEDVKRVFDYVDIFYIDIKHMDAAIHKKLTGVDNTLILENIRKVAVHYDFNWRSLIIRMPVIPGYNSSDDNVGTLFQFVKDLKVVKRVDLLPYHNLGSVKYDRIKFPNDYQLHDLDAIAPDALLLQIKDIGESMGVTVGIGG
jgi:pyruvate formate lyase activating enzyme